MGQLTNLYVSQSYQGLLKMTNSATGVTTSLQTVQTGDGADTPLQISQTQVNISGSLTVNGGPISVDTGSLVTTSSFNAYTGSNDARVNSLIAATGSYVTETESGSFVTSVTGSSATVTVTKGNGTTNQFTINNVQSSSFATNSTSASFAQNALSASYAPSSALPSGVVSGSAQISALGFAITGSNNFVGDQFVSGGVYISGSGELRKKGGTFNVQNDAGTNYFTVNTAAGLSQVTVPFSATSGITVTGSVNIQGNISATSASFTYVNTVYETASVIYSSGSNQFGDASNDTQTLYGTVRLPNGPLNVTGSALFSGSVGIWSGSYLETDGITNFGPGEDIEIAPKSAADVIVNLTNPTDKFIVKSQNVLSGGQALMEVTGSLSVTNGVNVTQGNLYVTGTTYNIYGNLIGTSSFAETASYFNGTVASASYATNADTASIARDVIVVGKCNNGGGLTRGTVVRIVGANGDNPLFDSASWTDETNSANVLGMLSEDVAFNGFANVVVLGKVLGLNTNAYTPSTNLYLSSSGQFTSTVPTAPSQSVRLGQVLRQNVNNGSIYFRADNGYELDELHNVLISSPQQGNILSYVSGSYGLWENKTSSQLGLATSSSVNLATGSLLKTGSVAGNVLTFTKGDGTSFNLTVDTGSASPINTGSFATTGSNNFTGKQTINNIGGLVVNDNTFTAYQSLDFYTGGTGTFAQWLSTADQTSLQSKNDLFINSAIGGVGTGSLTLTSNKNIRLNSPITNIYGGLNLNNATASGQINLQVESGSFTKTAINLNAEKSFIQGAGDLYFLNTWDAASSGSIYFNSPNQVNFLATSSVNISGSNNVDIKSSKISITGSLDVSGSLKVNRITTLADTNISGALITSTLNDGMIYINSDAYNSGSFKASISASNPSNYSNIFFGNATGAGTSSSTGSIVISGSNNIIMGGPRPNTIGQGTYGYLGGNINLMMGTSTLNTGSVLRPLMNSNIIAGAGGVIMTFASSSVAGGQPAIGGNIINAGLTVNMGASGSISANTNIINGNVSLLQTGSAIANLRSTFTSNNINSTFIIQNYNSSSFTANNNNTVGASHGIYNYFVNDFGTAGITTSRNFFSGQLNSIYVSGSSSSNTTRTVGDSFIGGFTNEISASLSGSNNANGSAIFMYGRNLVANATSATNAGGNAFLGRFNDTGSLANTNDIVLAVGTGTGTSARRTSLYVTTGSLVGVSGSLNVIGGIGAVSITGSMILSSSQAVGLDIQTFSTNHTGALFISSSGLVALDVKGYNTNLSSSLNLTGSLVQTGSLQQNVITLTNSSNTASLDLSQGNFFSYVLADSSANYLNPTNVKPGMRFTVKAIGTGPSSQIEINSAKFAGGPGLVAVGTSGSYRIFDFVSYDNSKPSYLSQYGLF